MTLAEHWNGTRWSAETTKHTGELDGVSCPATGNCTAVGWNAAGKALAAHWNGKAWSDESPANPQPVSLPGERVLPGHHHLHRGRHGRHRRPARRWPRLPWPSSGPAAPGPPSPSRTRVPQAIMVELNSVSCISATNCMAVGDDQNAAGTADTTAGRPVERHDLDDRRHAQPGDVQRALLGVVHLGYLLLAVGASSPTATGVVSPVAETWNGSTWSLQTAAG